MRPHFHFWLWVGGALMALCAASAATAGGLYAARDDYDFWTSPPMIAAYALATAAVFCLVAAVRDVPFPLVAESHKQAADEYRERKRAADAATQLRRELSDLMGEGNELSVTLAQANEKQPVEFALRTTELDAWWKRVEEAVSPSRPELLPVLRSESGRPAHAYVGHNDVYANWRNWLQQRISQLEKVMNQL